MIRGENNCAQHRSKAQHWTQTKGNNTQGALQRPRTTREKKCSSMRRFWAFLAAHGLLTTQISRVKLHNTQSRGKKTKKTTKKSHQSLSSEA